MEIYPIKRHTNVADFIQLSGSLNPHLMEIYAIDVDVGIHLAD
jgi:hypothetical protein